MSQTSSAHKIENMDKRVLQQLQEILGFCEKYGHQPAPDSEFGKIIKNIQHLIFVRSAKGIPTPENIPYMYAKIKSYPTASQHNREDLQTKNVAMRNAKQSMLNKKYAKIQSLTLFNLNIFKFICGNRKFERFFNADLDLVAAKAILDYFYAIYYNSQLFSFTGETIFPARARYVIELYVGDYTGKNIDDLKEILKRRTKEKHMSQVSAKDNQQLITKIEHKEPLTQKEIGYLTYMTSANIGNILRRTQTRFHDRFKDFESLLNLYIAGNTSAVISKLPAKIATIYKYQQNKKILDIPTGVLNRAGKTLMDFFAESIPTKQH